MEIEYRQIECVICEEKTSHVEIDTVDGRKWSCEFCGAYEGETVEENYYRMRSKTI